MEEIRWLEIGSMSMLVRPKTERNVKLYTHEYGLLLRFSISLIEKKIKKDKNLI